MKKKLSEKTLKRSWMRWKMAFAFCDSMIPVFKELYPDDAQALQEGTQRHSDFYCTEPQLGSIIGGIVCGLEEDRANGAEIDDEMINSIKIGLMGPLAGIGDSMIPGMYIPLLLSIGVDLSTGGNPLGPLFYMIVYFTTADPGDPGRGGGGLLHPRDGFPRLRRGRCVAPGPGGQKRGPAPDAVSRLPLRGYGRALPERLP